jgi:hypothetical protein
MLSYKTKHIVTYTPSLLGTAFFTANFQPDLFNKELSILIKDWLLLLFVTLDNKEIVLYLNDKVVLGVKCKVVISLVLAFGPSARA